MSDPLLRFRCPNCRKRLKAPHFLNGCSALCPKCGIQVQIPETDRRAEESRVATPSAMPVVVHVAHVEGAVEPPEPPPIVCPTRHEFAFADVQDPIIVAEVVQDPIVAELVPERLPRRTPLYAYQYRVPGERIALLLGFGAFLWIVLVASTVSFGVCLAAIVGTLFYVKMNEGALARSRRRITPQEYPGLNELFEIAAQRLSMHLPPAYIEESPAVQAYATGFMGPGAVVLHRGAIESFDADELLFVIGHELSHIKCDHTNWLVFTSSAEDSARYSALSMLCHILFSAWSRQSEHTCDRGGVLACCNPSAAISALAKLEFKGKIPVEVLNELVARHLKNGSTTMFAGEDLLSTHPNAIRRIAHIVEFVSNGAYQRLV